MILASFESNYSRYIPTGTRGEYPPSQNSNLDPQRPVYTGDPDLRVTWPTSIPTSILMSTWGKPRLVPSLNWHAIKATLIQSFALHPGGFLPTFHHDDPTWRQNYWQLRESRTRLPFCLLRSTRQTHWVWGLSIFCSYPVPSCLPRNFRILRKATGSADSLNIKAQMSM